MAISTVTNRVTYQGDGTSAVFNFQYEFFAQTDLGVFVYNSSGVQPAMITPKTLNTDYTISGAANSQGIYPAGANVVFNSTPNSQSIIVLFRSSVITNAFAIAQNGAIPSTSLNNELDYLTLIAQRQQDQITRSVRLHDGLGDTFDPTLPQNIKFSANKRLIVNSTATGFSFDESVGAYLQNTVIVAVTNSSIVSLGGAQAGYVLQSNGSSAPSWQPVNIGSGTAPISGILPVGNGGTGMGTSYIQYGVVFGSSPTQLANTAAGGKDQPLIGNNGAAPSYQPLNLASNSSVLGILPVGLGGTGTATSYIQFGLIYASSATQMGTVPSATAGLLLTSNGSSAPSFQTFAATNINSGIFSVAIGGTGTGTSYIQFGLIYASSATQLGTVPSATAGWFLTANGSSAPSFQVFAASNINSGIVAVANGGTGQLTSSSAFSALFPGQTKGDLAIRTATNSSVTPLAIGSDTAVLTADSSQITGMKWTQPVNASYTTLSGTTILTGLSQFHFDSLNFDTPNQNYNPASGVYTAPQTGKYLVSATIGTGPITLATNTQVFIQINKNSSAWLGNNVWGTGGASNNYGVSVSSLVQLNLNESVSIQVRCGTSCSSSTSSGVNMLSIFKVD